ncbi:MAG: nucleotidyltransferase [Algoriphagus sp. 32-45-6]|nr:MAG: nucleotidyltransferase [Algoriphagus sp. 32-45-6]
MKLERSQLDQIKKYFKDKPVLKAYLFGSYSREQATSDSDIDILVELDYSQKIGLKFFQMQSELEKILNHKVDLISNEALSPLIKPQVIRDRKLVYEK